MLESCNFLVKFADMKDLYLCYRNSLAELMLNYQDSKFFDNLDRSFMEIIPTFCDLAYSVRSTLLEAPSEMLHFRSETEENLSRLLEQDIEDLKAFSLVLRKKYDSQVQLRCMQGTYRLHRSCKKLLETMGKCLEDVGSAVSSNKIYASGFQYRTRYSMYLIIVEELYLICQFCKDASEREFWNVLKSRTEAVSWLLLRYAEPEHDYMWLLKHKGVGNFESRTYLIKRKFPEAQKPGTDLFKMLLLCFLNSKVKQDLNSFIITIFGWHGFAKRYSIRRILFSSEVKLNLESSFPTLVLQISLCQLIHPNIVKYLGTHRDEQKLCVFLELVANGSLIDIYKKHELKESQISSYTKSILEGLKYLHDQNIVHLDIKCANILVADDGRVKLADFGLAKAIESHQGFKSYAGSLAWMAPEFFNPDLREGGLVGIANDVWSLGCSVLRCL